MHGNVTPNVLRGEALCVLNWGVPSRKQSWMLKSKVLEDVCHEHLDETSMLDGLPLSKGG